MLSFSILAENLVRARVGFAPPCRPRAAHTRDFEVRHTRALSPGPLLAQSELAASTFVAMLRRHKQNESNGNKPLSSYKRLLPLRNQTPVWTDFRQLVSRMLLNVVLTGMCSHTQLAGARPKPTTKNHAHAILHLPSYPLALKSCSAPGGSRSPKAQPSPLAFSAT